MKVFILPVFLSVAVWLSFTGASKAQDQELPDEDVTRLTQEQRRNRLEAQKARLKLDSARTAMEEAKVDYEEALQLYQERIYDSVRLSKAKQNLDKMTLEYEEAIIELQKVRLNSLGNATLITVVDAIKYRGEDNEIMVSVRLKNDGDVEKARLAMGADSGLSDEDLMALLDLDNLVVSIVDSSRVIIGDPYQQIISKLKHGEEKSLEYRLLKKDVDSVTVDIQYLGDQSKQYTVFLKKEASQDLPTISSTQYAQQGQLGSEVRFDLTLERLTKSEQSFAPRVLNLPPAFNYSFRDPNSDARITQLRFTEEVSKQTLYFEVLLPEKLDQEFIDKNIEFFIIVTRPDELHAVSELRQKYGEKPIPAEEIAALKGNRVRLILIPKGVGKLEILVANLFKEVKQGEDISFKFTIMNSGTMAVRKVMPELDLPLEWEANMEPREADVIEPDEKVVFRVDVMPLEEVGEYPIRIMSKGHTGIETVEAKDKDFTIRIAAKRNLTGTIVLVMVLVGLVLIVSIASIKIARR